MFSFQAGGPGQTGPHAQPLARAGGKEGQEHAEKEDVRDPKSHDELVITMNVMVGLCLEILSRYLPSPLYIVSRRARAICYLSYINEVFPVQKLYQNTCDISNNEN